MGERDSALFEALAEVEFIRDRITHPGGRRARLDRDEQDCVDVLNEAWDAISALLSTDQRAA